MKYFITALLVINSIVFSQSVRLSDIDAITNAQLDKIKQELQSQNVLAEPEVANTINRELEEIRITASQNVQPNNYFGYNYFNRGVNLFDNISAPANYMLGPGDEVILSLWGETNIRKKFSINKDGSIFYDNIGFVYLANKTLKEAESTLLNELSRIYSTLDNEKNSTQLSLELGQLKSINVYFSGETESVGIVLIHPFSDLFTALIQSGVTTNGTLRKIKLTRSGKLVREFDFYSFFTEGVNNFSTIRILDGDIIHIPAVSNRVNISGKVRKQGFFELLDSDSLEDLIQYAGGFVVDHGSKIIIEKILSIEERSSDDYARRVDIIDINQISDYKPSDGSLINVRGIKGTSNSIEVLGRVKSPGAYKIDENTNLREVLDLAGGFDDPTYRKSIMDDQILVLRKDSNQYYGLEFSISYDNAKEFVHLPDDKVFVYENSNYDNIFSITVEGEVRKRGSYPLKKGMTVQDALNFAGGLTEFANRDGIIVSQEIETLVDDLGNTRTIRIPIKDASLNLELTDNTIISVLSLDNIVVIQGNVFNPGPMTYSRGQKVGEYIRRAGGLRPDTLKRKIYIQRVNGRTKNLHVLNKWVISPKPGDTIIVPLEENAKDFNTNAFLADLTQTLTSLMTIIFIVDSMNGDN